MQIKGFPCNIPFNEELLVSMISFLLSLIIVIGWDKRTFAFISNEYFINSGHVFVRPLNDGKNILILGDIIFFGSEGNFISHTIDDLLLFLFFPETSTIKEEEGEDDDVDDDEDTFFSLLFFFLFSLDCHHGFSFLFVVVVLITIGFIKIVAKLLNSLFFSVFPLLLLLLLLLLFQLFQFFFSSCTKSA